MKANELRIGNLVKYQLESWKISSIFKDGPLELVRFEIYKIANLKEFEPIPLTEEWLLKFGFEERKESENFSKWFIGENPVTHDWLFFIKQFKDENKFFFQNGFHKLDYLHQLQNLYFALTNNELEIL